MYTQVVRLDDAEEFSSGIENHLHHRAVDIFASYSTSPLPPPPPFQSVPSTEAITIEVSLEQVVQQRAPPVSDTPLRPEIFMGGIAERLGLRRRVTPSRFSVPYLSPERRSTPRPKSTQGASLSKIRKINFQDDPESSEGGDGQ
jgi:hypothetical protein